MSRFSAYDTDAERLPANMSRIGYDADTQRYQYQDSSDGSYWEGPPGSRYGSLRRVGDAAEEETEYDQADRLLAAEEGERRLQQGEKEAWRYILPFFLLCSLFLLMVFWFVGGWGIPFLGGGGNAEKTRDCGSGWELYVVKSGDSCWEIAETHGISVEGLKVMNAGLVCENLGLGEGVCVPLASAH